MRKTSLSVSLRQFVISKTVGPMKLTIDTGKCSGHARCYAAAPDVFDIDDMGYAVPVDCDVAEPLDQDIVAGVAACPERAISIR